MSDSSPSLDPSQRWRVMDQAIGLRGLLTSRRKAPDGHRADPGSDLRPPLFASAAVQANAAAVSPETMAPLSAAHQIGMIICPQRPFIASALAQRVLEREFASPTLWLDAIDFRHREGQGLPVNLRHDLEQVRTRQGDWAKACSRLAMQHWYASARRLQRLDQAFMTQMLSQLHAPETPVCRVMLSASAQHPIPIGLPVQLLWITSPGEPATLPALQAWQGMIQRSHQIHPLVHAGLTEGDVQALVQQLRHTPQVSQWLQAQESNP